MKIAYFEKNERLEFEIYTRKQPIINKLNELTSQIGQLELEFFQDDCDLARKY